MSEETLGQTKPRVNIGTIGHIGHGKTTLLAAISTALAQKYGGEAQDFASIDNASEERDRGITIASSHVTSDTPSRSYAYTDFPRHSDYIKAVVTGSAQMDAVIVVVSATDGPMPQTVEQIRTARQAGISHIIVFLNKCDIVEEEELLELIEMEVRELLAEYEFWDDNLPVIHGSALGALNGEQQWKAKILELAEAFDTYLPDPVRAIDQPFLLPIEEVFVMEERGTVATGRIERGVVSRGDALDIVGLKRTSETTCMGVEMFRKLLDEGRAGENVGVLLQGVSPDEVGRGQVLAAQRSATPHTGFEAEVYFLPKEEGGRHTPFFKGYRPQFYIRTAEVTGNIELPEGVEMAMPGDNMTMKIELIAPLALHEGLRFAIREGGRTVGAGVVAKILR